mmetsp:Transcript_18030/g.17216  ORF Transcript_18030/g.17216 Transcript_18030/m.17216 type:complete len:119 (+) Transcript_18030:1481-1837(+)
MSRMSTLGEKHQNPHKEKSQTSSLLPIIKEAQSAVNKPPKLPYLAPNQNASFTGGKAKKYELEQRKKWDTYRASSLIFRDRVPQKLKLNYKYLGQPDSLRIDSSIDGKLDTYESNPGQ